MDENISYDITLDPCPFCGDSVIWCACEEEIQNHNCHIILCKNCGSFDLSPQEIEESFQDFLYNVAKLWNTRV